MQCFGELGFGFDGIVVSTDRLSAVKSFRHEPLYVRERDVYLRLRSRNVTEVMGFEVPRLVSFDDDLWIVEMTIVSPPFVLDFAGAALDKRPQFPEDVLIEWQAEKGRAVRRPLADGAAHHEFVCRAGHLSG